MLSALARAIHNDVRNNDDQEVNLSSHPRTFAVQRAFYKNAAAAFTPKMERTGNAMSGRLWPRLTRR